MLPAFYADGCGFMDLAVPFKILRVLLAFFSTTMLAPAVVTFVADDGTLRAFVQACLLLLALGAALWWPVRRTQQVLRTRDGFLVVTLFWAGPGLAGALPFMLDEQLHMSLTNAAFESMSGFTTTGASVLSRMRSSRFRSASAASSSTGSAA